MSKVSPEMAVPMTVKMPEPMTAPIPSDVRETGRGFFGACVGHFGVGDELVMDLQQKAWRGRVRLLVKMR